MQRIVQRGQNIDGKIEESNSLEAFFINLDYYVPQ